VHLTERVKAGMIFMPLHFEEAAANLLTNAALDPISKTPEYKACGVRLEKIMQPA
jgi:predicted molibdopterin-dependent oxidoreductase YjgC